MGFGSGVVVPNTGISLREPLSVGFSTGSEVRQRGGWRQRPFHTIIPAFLTERWRSR